MHHVNNTSKYVTPCNLKELIKIWPYIKIRFIMSLFLLYLWSKLFYHYLDLSYLQYIQVRLKTEKSPGSVFTLRLQWWTDMIIYILV